jgi:hypothetical protein
VPWAQRSGPQPPRDPQANRRAPGSAGLWQQRWRRGVHVPACGDAGTEPTSEDGGGCRGHRPGSRRWIGAAERQVVRLQGRRRSDERAPVAGSSHRCQTGPEKAAGKVGGVEAVDDLEQRDRMDALYRNNAARISIT